MASEDIAITGFRVCSVCENEGEVVPTVAWCNICKSGFCHKCLQLHRRMPLSCKHDIHSIKEDHHKLGQPLGCSSHFTEDTTNFCTDCRTVFCDSCSRGDHTWCSQVLTLQNCMSRLGMLKRKLSENVQHHSDRKDKISSRIQAMNNKASKTERDIQTACQRIVASLKEKEQELITNLAKDKEDKIRHLKAKEQCDEVQSQFYESLITVIDTAIETRRAANIFKAFTDLATMECDSDVEDECGISFQWSVVDMLQIVASSILCQITSQTDKSSTMACSLLSTYDEATESKAKQDQEQIAALKSYEHECKSMSQRYMISAVTAKDNVGIYPDGDQGQEFCASRHQGCATGEGLDESNELQFGQKQGVRLCQEEVASAADMIAVTSKVQDSLVVNMNESEERDDLDKQATKQKFEIEEESCERTPDVHDNNIKLQIEREFSSNTDEDLEGVPGDHEIDEKMLQESDEASIGTARSTEVTEDSAEAESGIEVGMHKADVVTKTLDAEEEENETQCVDDKEIEDKCQSDRDPEYLSKELPSDYVKTQPDEEDEQQISVDSKRRNIESCEGIDTVATGTIIASAPEAEHAASTEHTQDQIVTSVSQEDDQVQNQTSVLDLFSSTPFLKQRIDVRTPRDKEDPYIEDIAVVDIDGVDHIAVTDWNNRSIKVYYIPKKQVLHYVLTISEKPCGITHIGDNNFAVSIPWKNKIFKLSLFPDFRKYANITTLHRYYGISYLSNSKMAACAPSIKSVDILDMSGAILQTITIDLMQKPIFCSARKGDFLVADTASRTVHRFSPEVGLIRTFAPTGENALTSPRGITHFDKYLFIVDGKRVLQMTEAGEYVRDILTESDVPDAPRAISINRHKDLYVSYGRLIKLYQFSS